MLEHADMEMTIINEEFLYSQIPRNSRQAHGKPHGATWENRSVSKYYSQKWTVQGRRAFFQ